MSPKTSQHDHRGANGSRHGRRRKNAAADQPMRPRRIPGEPACAVCGCTQNNACDGGCEWVGADLCSACLEAANAAEHLSLSLSRNRHWTAKQRTLAIAKALRRMQDNSAEADYV